MTRAAPRERARPGAAAGRKTPSLTLCFGVHDHQPAANFGNVFEEAADRAYIPFLAAAALHPGFHFSLHVSGGLLAWLEKHRPSGVDLIGELVERGQVEMMGGGFFEPILPAVPERDALGQMEMLSEHLERRFGRRPLGAWLAERVWEGRLAALLARAGFRYTVLDDHHFLRAGLAAESLRGHFVTEREGLPLRLFPIDQGLRYLVPFQPVNRILGRLREIRDGSGGVPCVTYADDGEKFGLWPGTHPLVYGSGWLRRFLEALESESAWLRVSSFAEAMEAFAPSGRAYLPDGSYREMTEWVLPSEARSRLELARERVQAAGLGELAGPFLAGGAWPGFLAKYPEANLMHKKMLWVSDALAARSASAAGPGGERHGEELERARSLLYRAQSNCAYWHGVFGGLYLGHLRHATYADLLEAESLVAPVTAPTLERLDFDRDGVEELWIRTPAMNLLLAPASGGGVPLLELREPRMNLANVLTRRPEAYHEEVRRAGRAGGKGDGGEGSTAPATIHDRQEVSPDLARELVYDRYPRISALEHILPGRAALRSFRGSRRPGREAPLSRYVVRETEVGSRDVRVLLEREGEEPAIEKELVLRDDALEVSWALSGRRPAGWFVVEWSLFFFSGKDPERRYVIDGEPGPRLGLVVERDLVRQVTLDDRPMRLAVSLGARHPFRLWAFPLNSVSRGEGGFEVTYQGTCVALAWPLDERRGPRRFAVRLSWRMG